MPSSGDPNGNVANLLQLTEEGVNFATYADDTAVLATDSDSAISLTETANQPRLNPKPF
jgi:hypothetical protein